MAGLFDGSVVEFDPEDDPFRDLKGLSDPLLEPLIDDRQPDTTLPPSPESPTRSNSLVSDLMKAEL